MFPTSAIQRRIQRNCRGDALVAIVVIYTQGASMRARLIAYLESSKADTENVHICG
jgi:hypothetical protein